MLRGYQFDLLVRKKKVSLIISFFPSCAEVKNLL
jgi:hypothetical protein